MEQRKRIIWLDYLKAIGILLVIIGHCALPPNLRKFIYSFHMPLFFFAGGLTLKMTSELSAKEFVKKTFNTVDPVTGIFTWNVSVKLENGMTEVSVLMRCLIMPSRRISSISVH